ncbi:MAG TPA: hypothetical protein VK530_01130 [Candidatus Acidoferrum sp.]|nr:hypothetical protein [Candidatus Acidoferrum sp.]
MVYRARYAVNYVRAQGLVVWDTLPQYADSLMYPPEINPTPYPGQNDNVTFASATKGGAYHAGPGALVVNGVSVPPNSVYWNLGNVDEGVTDLLTFTVATRNGTLEGTTLTNRAFATAANAGTSQSQPVVTVIRSVSRPSITKVGARVSSSSTTNGARSPARPTVSALEHATTATRRCTTRWSMTTCPG